MKFSNRIEKIPPYLFSEIDKKIEAKKAHGADIISFGIGDPDMPTPEKIVDTLRRESTKSQNQGYPSYFGLPEFREAASKWMRERFGVDLNPSSEIMTLIGAKEGIAHLPLAILNPGDVALVPEPAYPVYAMGTLLADGEVYYLPLEEKNNFLPELGLIPEEVLQQAKILWLNYPNNPTGGVAEGDFLLQALDFARENNLVLAYDNAYSEITYDGYVAPSILDYADVSDEVIEFHSLSKTCNMAGWRLGFACGRGKVLDGLGIVKTNIDSGVFNPIQLAGVTALSIMKETGKRMREIYERRRDFICDGLSRLGFEVEPPKGGIYIWMRVPTGFDSVSFSSYLLDKAELFFTPGSSYGPSGEGYVRVSLTVADERIEEALSRLKSAL